MRKAQFCKQAHGVQMVFKRHLNATQRNTSPTLSFNPPPSKQSHLLALLGMEAEA